MKIFSINRLFSALIDMVRLPCSITQSKSDKLKHLSTLFSRLWRGEATSAIDYLNAQVEAKNPEVLQELITYLQKQHSEIVDDQRRKQAGKPISSGRVEKAVDARSWATKETQSINLAEKGNRTLAILKVAELNN